MVQLVVNGSEFPEAYGSEGSYQAYESDMVSTLKTFSGKIIEAIQGKATVIEYSYTYLEDSLLRVLLSAKRSGSCMVEYILPSESSPSHSAEFVFEEFSNPRYLMSVGGVPYWTDISFKLRERVPR